MTEFFNKKELTEDQLEKWDYYLDLYEKTLGFNVSRELLNLHADQKEKYLEIFNQISFTGMKKSIELMGEIQGDEKSALFFRLISGKKPFVYRVPLSYGYPDYEIMEITEEKELDLPVFSLSKMIEKENGIKKININQCMWTVLSHTEDYAEITFGEWKKLGFKWSIQLKDIKAEKSQRAIIAHHDKSIRKITQYDQLVKEADYQVRNRLRAITINTDEKEALKMQEEYKKYNQYADIMYQQELIRGKDVLNERRSKNLSDYPTEDEIQEMVKQEIPKYLGKEYYFVENELYLKAWFIDKINNKEMKEEYYLSV